MFKNLTDITSPQTQVALILIVTAICSMLGWSDVLVFIILGLVFIILGLVFCPPKYDPALRWKLSQQSKETN
jgi:hypothetical protein